MGDIVSAALNKQKPDTARIDALIAAKKLGRKSGEGFYVWRDGKAVKPPAAGPAPPELEDRLLLQLRIERMKHPRAHSLRPRSRGHMSGC